VKRQVYVLTLLCTVMLISCFYFNCCAVRHTENGKRVFVDSLERTVRAERNQRVVSLSPELTELLFICGWGDRIIGRSAWCTYPPAAKNIPVLGNWNTVYYERLMELKPDIVFISAETETETMQHIESMGIPVGIVYYQSAHAMITMIEHLESFFGVTPQSKKTRLYCSRKIKQYTTIREKRKNAIHPRMFIMIDPSTLWTAGKGSILDEVITCAGFSNVVSELAVHDDYFVINAEQLLMLKPEYILCTWAPARTADSKASTVIPAWLNEYVMQNNVSLITNINPDNYSRVTPRIFNAIEELSDYLK